MNQWVIPYLTFNGNAREAIDFYHLALGGELEVMRFGDAPPNPNFSIPEAAKDLILHAELRKDGNILRFSDTFPGTNYTVGNNVSFSLEFDTQEETKATFEALSIDGKVEVEPQKTHFSPLYSKFTDKFRVIWQLRCRP